MSDGKELGSEGKGLGSDMKGTASERKRLGVEMKGPGDEMKGLGAKGRGEGPTWSRRRGHRGCRRRGRREGQVIYKIICVNHSLVAGRPVIVEILQE